MNKTHARRIRVTSLVLLAILAITALGAGGAYALGSSGVSFNNVQVTIQTSSDFPYTFIVSAYNSTGSLVSYTQSNYPAAAFELPSGTYLFTVTAYHYYSYPCMEVCVAPQGVATPSTNVKVGTILPPIRVGPDVEYGYLMQQVSGPQSITIKTQNASSIPTTSVSVKVAFADGTPASGAYVSAFVVGQSYYWWVDSGITMSAQADSNGMATLVVPSAPVEVSASLSVPVALPKNQTTITTTVEGQKINVTAYWQPMYVDFSGSALIIPPQTSASITLQYQQPVIYYTPTPYVSPGVAGGGGYAQTVTMTASQGTVAPQGSGGQTASSEGQSAPALSISPFTLGPQQSSSTHASQASSSQASTGQASTSQAVQSPQSTPANNTTSNSGTASLLIVAVVATVAVVLAAIFLSRARTKQ